MLLPSRLALGLFLVMIPFAAPVTWAQTSSAADIRHYDLLVTPDFATRRVRIVATLVIVNPSNEGALSFFLSDRYADVQVRDGDAAVPVERESNRITVRLQNPGDVDTLVFDIAGAPGRSEDEEREVVGDRDLFLLWSDRFYPIVFEDWATVRTTLALPRGFQAIAPGRLISEVNSDSVVRVVFETSHPTRKFSIFADDRWIRSERTVEGIRIVTLLHPESAHYAERIIETSADVLAFYADLHGGYPFDGFAFVTLEGMYARRAFSGFVGYSPAYLVREMKRTGHDAHETALLWWGYTSGGRGPGSFQWTEGLGDYVEILYDEARGKAIPAIFDRFRTEYLASPVSEEPSISELRGSTPQKFVHGKYPWLMHVLRYVVGDEEFRAGLRLLFDRYRFRTFSIDDLVGALEEGTGRSLTWWREEWLERKGVPQIRVEYRVKELADGWAVEGRVTQTGEIYHIPLEIGIESAGGMLVERVELAGRETTFALESRARPLRVVVDPHRWLLLRMQETVVIGE